MYFKKQGHEFIFTRITKDIVVKTYFSYFSDIFENPNIKRKRGHILHKNGFKIILTTGTLKAFDCINDNMWVAKLHMGQSIQERTK